MRIIAAFLQVYMPGVMQAIPLLSLCGFDQQYHNNKSALNVDFIATIFACLLSFLTSILRFEKVNTFLKHMPDHRIFH